jgi:hypothetical protein
MTTPVLDPANARPQPPWITSGELERLISPERFATYLSRTGDPDRALALYRWNACISGAFAELLHHVEVIVRNAMHDRLAAYHATVGGRPPGAAWFDEPRWVRHHWFHRQALTSISRAVGAAGHTPAMPRPGKVISDLNFGFWRYLASDRYEQSFWTPALDHSFTAPGKTVRARRHAVEDRIAPLHLLRNRIAHCEPIFGTITYRRRRKAPATKSLGDLRSDALELVSWVSPAAATWLTHDVDQVARLISTQP